MFRLAFNTCMIDESKYCNNTIIKLIIILIGKPRSRFNI